MDNIFSEDVECVEYIQDIANLDIISDSSQNTAEKYVSPSAKTPTFSKRLVEFTEIVKSLDSEIRSECNSIAAENKQSTRRSRTRKDGESSTHGSDGDSDWEEPKTVKKKARTKEDQLIKQNVAYVDHLFKFVDKIGKETITEVAANSNVEYEAQGNWPLSVRIVLVDQNGEIVKDSKLEKVEIQRDETCADLSNRIGREYGLDETLWDKIKVKLEDEVVDRSVVFGDDKLDIEEGVQIDIVFPCTK